MKPKEVGSGSHADPRRRFGDRGEDFATVFFLARGFRVVERNWSCRSGEIDLILERAGQLHFVEVKTRRTATYGYPEEAITPTKLRHLARAIESYLQVHPAPGGYQADALAISILTGKKPEFNYIQNIL